VQIHKQLCINQWKKVASVSGAQKRRREIAPEHREQKEQKETPEDRQRKEAARSAKKYKKLAEKPSPMDSVLFSRRVKVKGKGKANPLSSDESENSFSSTSSITTSGNETGQNSTVASSACPPSHVRRKQNDPSDESCCSNG